jgi:hypothetical protein
MNQYLFSIDDFQKFNKAHFRKVCNKNLIIETLTQDHFTQVIESLSEEIKNRTYTVSDYKEYFRIKDKDTNIIRRVINFEFRDFFLYLYLVFQLQEEIAENRVKNTFGGFRFSHAISKKESEDKDAPLEEEIYPTMNKYAWSKVYGEFNSVLASLADAEDSNFVVEIDIANFYDNINLSLLEESIRHKVNNSKSKVISLLFYFLHFWDKKYNFYNAKTAGIPQDIAGEPSRILANFYLQIYDEYIFKKCEEMGVKYVRYADDQVFFAKDQESLRKIVYLASKFLSQIYLNINNKKVSYESVETFKKKRFGISFYDNFDEMYKELESCDYAENPNLFVKGFKRLIALINKSNSIEHKEYSNSILKWIEQDNYVYLFSIKSFYELEYLKNISKKLDIESEVREILKSFIGSCFDDLIVEFISKVWSEKQIKEACSERIQEIHNL